MDKCFQMEEYTIRAANYTKHMHHSIIIESLDITYMLETRAPNWPFPCSNFHCT